MSPQGRASYREWIAQSSAERNSRVILALDLEGNHPIRVFDAARRLLSKTVNNLCAVKLQRQTVLNLGTDKTQDIVELIHEHGIPCLVDDKLNDIGETNRAIAETYFRLGVDGLTASPFVGWTEGLEPLFKVAHANGKGVIVLVYMSHPGASEGYGRKVMLGRNRQQSMYVLFARRAARWLADGVVVGATRLGVIEEVKRIVKDQVPIYSPGIGVQGGRMVDAAKAGTDYFIVGRSITKSKHPEKVVVELARESAR